MKILIVKFGALGDVIRTSYILKGLTEKYNYPKIYWLTSETSFELLRFNPYIYFLATPDFGFNILQNINFDLCISLEEERNILNLLKKLNFSELVGAFIDKSGNITYTKNSALWFDMSLISKYGKKEADRLKKRNQLEHNQILEKILKIKIDRGIFFNSQIIEERVKQKLNFDNNYFKIGINSGAGGRWKSKQLTIDETIKLITKLISMKIHGKPVKIYLLGGPEEIERNKIIINYFKANQHIVDTGTNNSLLEFAAIIKFLDYVITSDSLALHLSIAQGIKNLSFYAPTSASEIGTFGLGTKVVSTSKDYCNYKKDCDNSTITAERIINAFKKHICIGA